MENMWRCFQVLLVLLLGDAYRFQVPGGWLLSFEGMDLPPELSIVSTLRIHELSLPTGLRLAIDQHAFSINQTACIHLLVDIPSFDTVNNPLSICGGVQYDNVQKETEADAASCAPQPMNLTACSASVEIAFGDFQIPVDICPLMPQVIFEMPADPPAFQLAQVSTTSSLAASPIVIAMQRIVRHMSDQLPISMDLQIPESNTLRLSIRTDRGRNTDDHVLFDSSTWSDHPLFKVAQSLLDKLHNISQNETAMMSILGLIGHLELTNGPVTGSLGTLSYLPPNVHFSLDVRIPFMECTNDGYTCLFPSKDALIFENIALTGMSTVDAIARGVGPFLANITSGIVNNIIFPTLCHPTSDPERCSITITRTEAKITPPLWLLIVMPVVAVTVTILIVACNVRRNHRKPLHRRDGSPVSDWRIIVEDSIFCLCVFGAMACFLSSNITSAATVLIGGEVNSYAFSLINTVTDLWKSGLKPLSIFVMAFSGIYPYFKLLCMLLYTVVLYRPESMVLKVIDVIGKYSFIDMFVMLIFVSGLKVPGVADVNILPSFYLFMGATACSIACGNYATILWRRGTSVRSLVLDTDGDVTSLENPLSSEDGLHTPDAIGHSGLKSSAQDSDNGEVYNNCVSRFLHRVWWPVSIPSFLLVLALTLPAVVSTTLSYSVGGIASLFVPSSDYTLITLSTAAGASLLLLTLVTIVIAPLLCALLFDECVFIGAWTAADVMLLACIAGLLQLNQFVQFILGDGFEDIYTADAKLHWPLIPLLIAAIVIWMLQVLNFTGWGKNLKGRMSQWWASRHTSRGASDTDP